MSILFITIYVVWLLTEILLNRFLHSKTTDRKNADKNSLMLIWVTIIATITIAVFISIKFYLPIFSNPVFKYAGLAIIVVGILLRLIAVASLGRFFTVDVTIKQGHKLKKDGVYKYVRHPSYSASLLSFIGFGISLNNWLSLLITIVAILTVFIFRIKIEEKILIEQFGAEYLEYKKTTSGIIPFIY